MNAAKRAARWRPFALGLLSGVALAAGGQLALPFVTPSINLQPAVPPVDQRPLTIRQDAKGDGRFGAPRSGNRSHRGIDLEAPLGTPVRAIRGGVVQELGTHRGLGRFVAIRHSGELSSLYAHMQSTAVKEGQRIRQGQVIGTVGKTGNARHRLITPHLHFEVLREGTPVNPVTLGLAIVEPAGRTQHADATGGE